MILIRKSKDRGHANYKWLDSYHTFSFSTYHDPAHMQFGVLRVINEDRIAPSRGFDLHNHENMEIVTYVIEGSLKHIDNLGHTTLIRTGDVQRMSAGTGIEHGEFNGSDKDFVHMLQIWIFPEKNGLTPSYEQKNFPDLKNRLCLVVSKKGEDGSLTIHQDVKIFASRLEDKEIVYEPKRSVWIQVIEGPLTCNGTVLQTGDGAQITDENKLVLTSPKSHFLLFDLPKVRSS